MTTKALTSQPSDQEQILARVFDRIEWTVAKSGNRVATVGKWVLEVRPGLKFWDWKLGWEAVKGTVLAHSAGDETSEAKAKRAVSDALGKNILTTADGLNLVVSLGQVKGKEPRRKAS